MFRTGICLAAILAIACSVQTVSAQTTAPAEVKPSRVKLTAEKLKEMKVRWLANRPKLKACRKEVRAKGLVGDARWFYMEDCMTKT